MYVLCLLPQCSDIYQEEAHTDLALFHASASVLYICTWL